MGVELFHSLYRPADWVTVAVLVLVMIPFIVVMGLRYARPLAAVQPSS